MNKWRADRRAGRVALRGDRRLHMVRHPEAAR
jgi:hypothetical protein